MDAPYRITPFRSGLLKALSLTPTFDVWSEVDDDAIAIIGHLIEEAHTEADRPITLPEAVRHTFVEIRELRRRPAGPSSDGAVVPLELASVPRPMVA